MKAKIAFNRLFPILLLGFSSGLPLALTNSTLQAWLTESGLSLVTIGWFSLVGQPYVYKFLWAPFLDRFTIPILGRLLDRRRSWILLTQIFLLILFICMGQMSIPGSNAIAHPGLLAFIAFGAAAFSATQDVAYDAYRTDILLPQERGLGSSMMVIGYRLAVLISGAFALIIAKYAGWRATYSWMAMLMFVGMIGTVWAAKLDNSVQAPKNIKIAFIAPIKEFFSRPSAWMILLLIFLYKVGDAFTLTLNTAFLLRGLHFSLIDLGVINKVGGLIATVVGGLLGGFLMVRLKLFQALWWFGLLQAFSTLTYMILAIVGKNYAMMASTIILENACSGMGTAAFLALCMALCDHRYSATQFALFSAIATLGRVYLGPLAGIMVEHIGWVDFYFWAFLSSFPGLVVLWMLKNNNVFSHQNKIN
jgi:PAT family beta-lactamase induction signal transducer AmpG